MPSTMTNEGRMSMHSGHNIEDFGQLLTSFHPYLRLLLREQEKADKKPNSKFLSVIFNNDDNFIYIAPLA